VIPGKSGVFLVQWLANIFCKATVFGAICHLCGTYFVVFFKFFKNAKTIFGLQATQKYVLAVVTHLH
jgi:hypothetical protein